MPFNNNHKQYIKRQYIIHKAGGLQQVLWLRLQRSARGRLLSQFCKRIPASSVPVQIPGRAGSKIQGISLYTGGIPPLDRIKMGGQRCPSLPWPHQSPPKLCWDPLRAALQLRLLIWCFQPKTLEQRGNNCRNIILALLYILSRSVEVASWEAEPATEEFAMQGKTWSRENVLAGYDFQCQLYKSTRWHSSSLWKCEGCVN